MVRDMPEFAAFPQQEAGTLAQRFPFFRHER
jgi:hypothetical protein